MPGISSSDAKKPMELPNLLEAILTFIWSLLLKAFEYLSGLTDIFNKSSTPTKNLSDMPVDVVLLIVERLEYWQQLKLRKVSKSLRTLIDKHKPACKWIRVAFWRESIVIYSNNQSVAYTDQDNYFKFDIDCALRSDDFERIAFDDLALILKNPKLQLEKFRLDFIVLKPEDIEQYYNKIRKVLDSLNHQLSVEKVELRVSSPSSLLSILPYLKPGVLEGISLQFSFRNWIIDPIEMGQVALLEQWKQAEELELIICFDRFPLEYATHFKRFRIREDGINGEKFARIKNFLSKLDNFEECALTFNYVPDSVYELLGEPVSGNTTEEIFHHPIPDSDYYFVMEKAKESHKVKIEKKKTRENNL